MKIIIVGGGKVGANLATMLLKKKHDVAVIESRLERVQIIKEELPEYTVILGSGTDPNILESAGIQKADVVATVTGKDEVNLVVTNLARVEYGVPRIVARVNNPKNAWLFTPEMGVDVIVNQAEITAELITEGMSLHDMHTYKKLLQEGNFSLIELHVEEKSSVVGTHVQTVILPPHCTLVAVFRSGELMAPSVSQEFMAGDEVIAFVATESVEALKKLFL